MENSKYFKPIIKAIIAIIIWHFTLTFCIDTIGVIIANNIAIGTLEPSDAWFMIQEAYNNFIKPMFGIFKIIVYVWYGSKIVFILKNFICEKGENEK